MSSENNVDIDDVIRTLEELLRGDGCSDPKVEGLEDTLERITNQTKGEPETDTGIPKGVSPEPPMTEYVMFITSIGMVVGQSYDVLARGVYHFKVRNMKDALAVAQGQIPHVIFAEEDLSKLGWRVKPDNSFAELIREDGSNVRGITVIDATNAQVIEPESEGDNV